MTKDEIEQIIVDILDVAKVYGKKKIRISLDENQTKRLNISELDLPTRVMNRFNRAQSVDSFIDTISDDEKLKNMQGIGVSTIADAKNAILRWVINDNIAKGRPALAGISM